MPAITIINDALAVAACDASVDAIDNTSPGTLTFYDGAMPGGPDNPAGATALAVLPWPSSPAFQAAAIVGGNAAVANHLVVPDPDTTAALGTAAWVRITDGAGTGIMDLNCGTTDEAVLMNSVSFTLNGTVSITSLTHTVPTGAGP